MITTWTKAVEQAADVIGEMHVAMVSDAPDYSCGNDYSYENIAEAALDAGLKTLLGDEPGAERVDHAARVIYEKLHDPEQPKWNEIRAIEQNFWLDIARAAIRASDVALLREAEV